MRRNVAYVVIALAVALLVGGLRIHFLLERLMAERTDIYVKQAGGHNRFVHQKLLMRRGVNSSAPHRICCTATWSLIRRRPPVAGRNPGP